MDATVVDATVMLGLAAGTLTTASFVPQLVKVWRTKSAEDISMGMFATFCAGVVLWLIYGIALRDVAIIAANGVTLVLALAIMALKIRYARRP
jgi:MtN3 and saliva related transmembrane protein